MKGNNINTTEILTTEDRIILEKHMGKQIKLPQRGKMD